MQHPGGYFSSNEDDHSALLEAFPMPLPLDEPAAENNIKYDAEDVRQPENIAPYHGSSQFNPAYGEPFAYPDPLQVGSISGPHLQDLDKQGRSDQMKLTFIMDRHPGAGSASKQSTATSLGSSMFPGNAMSTPTHVQDFAGFPSVPETQIVREAAISMPAALVPSQTNKRMQACSACGIVFTMKSKALYHLYVKHPESAPAKVYPCSRCDNAFLRKSDMVSTLRDQEFTYSL